MQWPAQQHQRVEKIQVAPPRPIAIVHKGQETRTEERIERRCSRIRAKVADGSREVIKTRSSEERQANTFAPAAKSIQRVFSPKDKAIRLEVQRRTKRQTSRPSPP